MLSLPHRTLPIMAEKRDKQVGVKLNDHDLKRLRKAGAVLWPGITVSSSTLILTLARQRAEEVLRAKRTKNE
jgi:hypothetical protein